MAISDTIPPKSFLRGGKVVVPFDIKKKQVADPQTGKLRTQYEYDEAEGDNKSTAQQVAEAKQARALAGIADMTYAELDTYIETNVTTLASARAFLKKLAKVVLALVKEQQ